MRPRTTVHDLPQRAAPRPSAVAVLALALLFGGCDLFSNPREKAAAHLAKGDFAAARIEATNAIQADETDGEAHLVLGQVLLAQGDLVTAERALGKAATLGIDPNRVDGLRAQVLLNSRAYGRIIEDLKPTPSHQGEVLALVLAARGQAQLALRKHDEARVSLDAALKAAPDLPEALLGQAQLAYVDQKPEEALALTERVIAKSPQHAGAWETRAALLQLQGKADEAISALEQAAAADPTDATPLLAAAQLSIGAKRFEAAQKYVDSARKRAPNTPLIHYLQAALHFEQEQYDKALVLAQEILRMRPRFAPAVMLAAMTHLARGEPNQAENLLRPLVQSQPKDLAARRLYATALLQMGNAKGALETLAPALAQSNDDPALLTLAADAYARLKDFTKATAYYEQAAKLEPDRTELLARAGLARFAGGDETQGLATLESAAARSADSLGADTALFSLLLKQQEFEKALAVARNIQSKAAENPIGYNLAGLALLRLKDTAAARKSFERAAQLDPSYWPAAANLVRMELATGEKAAAQARIERVLSKDRSNVEAASALMQVTGDRGQFVRSLEAARQDDPKALALRLVLVEAYLEKGLADHALPIAREAVAIAPQSNEALALLGSAQLAAGRHGESLNTFRELVVRLPASSQAQVRLAGAQAALNELSGAESAYRKALTMKPGDAESLAGLARLYGRQKRFDEALKLAAELRAAQPKAAIGHALAGDLYLDARRHPEAIQAYEAAFSLRPSGDLVVKRHAARLAAGEQPGNTNLIQWLDTHPDDLMVRLHLANQHYRAGAFRDAITEYAAIVKADPNHAFALNNLASAFLKLNDKRALSVAEAAHQLKPDHASILDTLGVAQMRYGDAAAAVDTLKKAIARQPEVAEFRVNYALALARSGEKAAARAELQKVLVSSKGLVLEPEAKALLETR